MSLRVFLLPLFPHRVLFFAFIFLFFFPKGGFRIGGVPMTWGYLCLMMLGYIYICRTRTFTLKPYQIRLIVAWLPFQLSTLLALYLHGIASYAFAFSFVCSFFILPFLFLILLERPLHALPLKTLSSYICYAIWIVALFGIIQFVIRMTTGKHIHIPFLTINYHDFLMPESMKCNDRGGMWYKLTSTFQNGIVYGVAMSFFLPLFYLLEKRWKQRLTVTLSLLLTLSRTVWVVLVLAEILHHLYVKKITQRSMVLLLCKLILCLIAAYFLTLHMGKSSSFIYDPSLGGRWQQLMILQDWNFLGHDLPFQEIMEMTYLSILKNFGLLGLITFLGAMTAPFRIFHPHKNHNPLKRALGAGLILYLITATADGALLYIPIMAFYWITLSLLAHPEPTQGPA